MKDEIQRNMKYDTANNSDIVHVQQYRQSGSYLQV